jgi:hypothetical protein
MESLSLLQMAPYIFKENIARCQWLTPVILATLQAEIRRIEVQNLPEQIVLPDPISKKKKKITKKGWWSGSSPSTAKKKKKERERKNDLSIYGETPADFSYPLNS